MSNYVKGHVTKYSAGTEVKFPNSTVTIPTSWEVHEYCSPFGCGDYILDIFIGKVLFTAKYTISSAAILQTGTNATDTIRERY